MKLILYFFSVCIFTTNTIYTQSTRASKSEKIDELLSQYNAYGQFNGTILVAEAEDVVLKKGYGYANKSWDIPNAPDTKFRLASMTKQFTAMLVMQLVADEKLNLKVPITTYLPDYPKANGDQITIHHLLSHTSGIPNYTSFPDYQERMGKSVQPTELVDLFSDSTLQFTPGERFDYSNSGYVLLGVIIEKITGKSIDEVLYANISKPLGMDDTGYEQDQKIIKNQAQGYYNNLGNYTKSHYINLSVAYTAGGMYSTVEDMFRWDQALYSTKLLPQQYLDLLFTKYKAAWGQHVGYGWFLGEVRLGNTENTKSTIEHDGVINGFNTQIVRIPSEQKTIILLSNAGGAPLRSIVQAISGILYDQPYDFPKKSVASSLLKVIKEEGIDKAKAHFTDIKDAPNYYLQEHEINIASYHLLENNQPEAASAIIQLGITAFPGAFNLYDSYGEILTKLGNIEAAIENYKHSLKLNPRNENAINMLQKLGVEIDRSNLYLLKTPPNWNKENFTFPLRFAPNIPYVGIEEAHFTPGWRSPESSEFWSYTFAWEVDQEGEISTKELEQHVQLYFDGLLNVVNRNKDLVVPSSTATFTKIKQNGDRESFTGTVNIFDTFVTQKPLSLKVKVEQQICTERQESILFFRYSPKPFDHEMWEILNSIQLRANACTE